MIEDKRILKVIEGLTMGDIYSVDQQKLLDQIYKFSHLAGNCNNKHLNWQLEFLEIEKALIAHGTI